MELANGKQNELFQPPEVSEDRYKMGFDPRESVGNNNVVMLAESIAPGSLVLDLGCAEGRFGAELRDRDCRVIGVDIDAEAIRRASETGHYEAILRCDIEQPESPEYQTLRSYGDFDVVLLSDVLEHVMDPSRLLMHAAELVRLDGLLLVSVPNAAHADIPLHLLDGQFNYQAMGILDNTHVKFFTKRSFCQWIAQLNAYMPHCTLECAFLGATFYRNAYLDEIERAYPSLYHFLQRNPEYDGLQILFRLEKRARGTDTPQLDALLESPAPDVVEAIGKALEGTLSLEEKVHFSLVDGERRWFLQQMEKAEGYRQSYEAREGRVQWLEEQAALFEKNIGDLEGGILELRNALDAKEEALQEALRRGAQELNALRREKESEEATLRTEKESLEDALLRADQARDALQITIEGLEQSLLRCQAERDTLRQQNLDTERALSQSDGQREALRQAKEEMESSLSWQMTGWIRKLHAALKRK